MNQTIRLTNIYRYMKGANAVMLEGRLIYKKNIEINLKGKSI